MVRRTLAVLLLLSVVSCDTAPRGTGAASDSDDSVIRQLEDQERLGILNRDTATLTRIWDEQFMVNSPFNTVSPNRAVVLDLVRQGMIHYSSFERRIEDLRMLGDLAIVMGAETVQPVAEPPASPVQRRFTHIWRNDGGSWHLMARHANDIPQQ